MPYKDQERNNWRAKVIREKHSKTRSFDTKREAKAWESEQKALPIEEFLRETPLEYSLAEWTEKYLEHSKAKFVKKTFEEKRVAFRELFKLIDPSSKPEQLHPSALLSHFNAQHSRRSGNAANKDRKNLIAAWNWATKYLPGWPERNPFAQTERQRGESHPRYIPSVEDFYRVYDGADGQDKIMLLTYLHTAARRAELFQLTWDDVDFGGKRVRLWTNKRKGGRECDWVAMTSELYDGLAYWFEHRTFKDSKHVFLCEDATPFCVEDYGRPFLYRQHWLRRLCQKVSVAPFGIHAIRHLSASILDDKCYPITVIQSLLRHKNANTTALYLHKLRGMRVALDGAFRREDRPAFPERSAGRPALKLVNLK